MSKILVEARNLTKIYQRDQVQVPAFQDVSLEIHAGEFVALMGPSGSGKSTLLNIIAGIDRPTRGEIKVLNTNILSLKEDALAAWRSAHIGYVFQTFNLIAVLNAFENVELPLLLMGLSARQRREHVETALRLVGLSDRMDHYPRQLSGGQEQRVAIARALVTDPDLLLADEPTGDLDAKSATEVLALLERLNRDFKKTIIMVTHDPHAAEHATVIFHLEKGQFLSTEKAEITK